MIEIALKKLNMNHILWLIRFAFYTLMCIAIISVPFIYLIYVLNANLADKYITYLVISLFISFLIIAVMALMVLVRGLPCEGKGNVMIYVASIYLIFSLGIFYIAIILSYFAPFNYIDEACKDNSLGKPIVNLAYLKIFQKESFDYFKYFDARKEENGDNFTTVCRKYIKAVKIVAENNKGFDYNENQINKLIFESTYTNYFYSRWDIGEVEYNKKWDRLLKEAQAGGIALE